MVLRISWSIVQKLWELEGCQDMIVEDFWSQHFVGVIPNRFICFCSLYFLHLLHLEGFELFFYRNVVLALEMLGYYKEVSIVPIKVIQIIMFAFSKECRLSFIFLTTRVFSPRSLLGNSQLGSKLLILGVPLIKEALLFFVFFKAAVGKLLFQAAQLSLSFWDMRLRTLHLLVRNLVQRSRGHSWWSRHGCEICYSLLQTTGYMVQGSKRGHTRLWLRHCGNWWEWQGWKPKGGEKDTCIF